MVGRVAWILTPAEEMPSTVAAGASKRDMLAVTMGAVVAAGAIVEPAGTAPVI